MRGSRPVHVAGTPGLSSPAQVNVQDTVWQEGASDMVTKMKGKHNLP